jgi:uncharacterized membrane protein
MEKLLKVIQCITLCFMLLVVGVFWGNYFSFSRSFHLFSVKELIHIAQILVDNIAVPMRFISMICITLLGTCVYLLWPTRGKYFYLVLVSWILIVTALVLTVAIEVPINDQIISWTDDTVPSNWEELRDRWQFVNVIRTIAALLSFFLFAVAVVKPFEKK